jgi:predicted NAD/FAD-binding protein
MNDRSIAIIGAGIGCLSAGLLCAHERVPGVQAQPA